VRPTPAVAPARAVAHAVVLRCEQGGAFADRALPAQIARAGLDARARALATRLTYGTIQRTATLDALIEQLSSRPPARIAAGARIALRLGLYQLLFLEGIADHAAVNESVELAKGDGRKAAGLVNAVLRRAASEGEPWLRALGDATPAQAAVLHSHPRWLAERWFQALGADTARALMAADNEPAESAVRANTLFVTGGELVAELRSRGVRATRADGLDEAVVIDGAFDARGSDLARAGALMPQARASMLVARTLEPMAGERVLDLCAAPGAKTTHLAALAGGKPRTLVAVERHQGRATALRRTCEQFGVDVEVRCGDARELARSDPEGYDRVLVDVPCSGLGTLRSHPDARWRVRATDARALAPVQGELLAAAATAVAVGGVLVYSTCTIEQIENDDVVDTFLEAHRDFRPAGPESRLPLWDHAHMEGRLQTLPHRDSTDGFYIARMVRE